MARSKPNETIQAYRKERRRIQQSIRRLEKRGYRESKQILPDIPKRITKASVERLKKINIEKIYKKVVYVVPETGEMTSSQVRRKQERKESARKGVETKQEKRRKREQYYGDNEYEFEPPSSRGAISFSDVIINSYKLSLNRWNEIVQNKVNSWLDNLINRYGSADVSRMLTDAYEAGLIFTYSEAYSLEKLHDYFAHMLNFMPELGDFEKDQLNEEMEEMLYENEDMSL